MQLIRGGPDIPDRLLEAHEDGRVVFFCGAGISYPAGLPSFSGLIKKLFNGLNILPSDIEKAAIKRAQYDTAVGLLEGRIVGGRALVRQKLAEILTPDLTRRHATTTHKALLTLARNRNSQYRLITTNFDRLFEEVIAREGLAISTAKAPLLPVPKTRWDGLVYLHGLLTDTLTESELNCLVISSGDFGLAYLTERWAARFISEVFRNHTVCFVGYSINDPVMRYVMDALAADRLLGESPPEVFAFGSYSKRRKADTENEWKAKNVTPILYQEYQHHAYLQRTLRAWADVYRDGILGKERIVVQYAATKPLASTQQDDISGRVLWALSDPSGLPAKRFAELDPAPPFDWLEALSDTRFAHGDLRRFGVQPNPAKDVRLAFSLIARPTPYLQAPFMRLVQDGKPAGQLDDVMFHLARWLLRYLDNAKLLLWVVAQGGTLHPTFERMVASEIESRSLPRPIQTLWRLALSGRLRGHR